MGVCASQKKTRPMWKNVNDIPSFVPQATHKTSKHNSADKPSPSAWRKSAARPYVRPTSSYFQNGYWPRCFDSMYVRRGYWDTAVKPSAGCSWTKKGPNFQRRPKNNGGSYTSTWPNSYDPQGRLKSVMT
jgi:hypothetical protein